MADQTAPVIEAQGLVKRLNRRAVLNKLDFRVEPGESVAVVGPNGAGKTTLLRILASLMRADTGTLRVLGYRLPDQAPEMRQRLGVVNHQPLLYGELSAEDNLHFYSRLYGLETARQRINDVLLLMNLASRSRDLVRTFSRGMQQRLAIARALLHEPELLLMDEPLTGLDEDSTRSLSIFLRQWVADGRSIVMTGHDMEVLQRLVSRCEILLEGRLLASSAVDPRHGAGGWLK